MARDFNKVPISLREGLVIIAIFVIIFCALFKFTVGFYLGIFIIIILIIERFFGNVFNPGKTKVNLE